MILTEDENNILTEDQDIILTESDNNIFTEDENIILLYKPGSL